MHETGCSGLVHWDNPEGWDGEGGRSGVQDGEPMYTQGWFMSMYGKTHCCCCCWVTSVVSDSVPPHRQQPTRLPHPWDSPGKNTGVGCHFLLQCIKVKSEVAQSCPTLSDPMDCSLPGSSVHGIFQARVLEWVLACNKTGHGANSVLWLTVSGWKCFKTSRTTVRTRLWNNQGTIKLDLQMQASHRLRKK